jgi:hypothetical protein
MDRFTLEETAQQPLNGDWVCPRAGLEAVVQTESLGIELQFSDRQPRSLATKLSELRWLI